MDQQQEDSTHPLDRDYTLPVAKQPKIATTSYPRLLRGGVIVFAAGFVAVLLGGILVSNYPGNSWGESIGSFIHRFGMVGILVGAVLIILANRWAQLTSLTSAAKVSGRVTGINAYLALVFWNVVGVIAFSLLFYLAQLSRTTSVVFLLFNAIVTITCAFMITLLVWHRGFIRAYAIGVLVAVVLNIISGLIGLNGRYWRNDGSMILLAHFATIAICGLVCGGYVYLLEAISARQRSRRLSSLRRAAEQQLTDPLVSRQTER